MEVTPPPKQQPVSPSVDALQNPATLLGRSASMRLHPEAISANEVELEFYHEIKRIIQRTLDLNIAPKDLFGEIEAFRNTAKFQAVKELSARVVELKQKLFLRLIEHFRAVHIERNMRECLYYKYSRLILKYSPFMCKNGSQCEYGFSCFNAHDDAEIDYHPLEYYKRFTSSPASDEYNSYKMFKEFAEFLDSVAVKRWERSAPGDSAKYVPKLPEKTAIPFKTKLPTGEEVFLLNGETLDAENKIVEYKDYHFEDPIHREKNLRLLRKPILAFLNRGEGSVYLGIHEENDESMKKWIVRGVPRKLIDVLKNSIVGILKELIPRKCAQNCVQLREHKIVNASDLHVIDSLVVFELHFVRPADFFFHVYVSPNNFEFYIREDGESMLQGEGPEQIMSYYLDKIMQGKTPFEISKYRAALETTVTQIYLEMKSRIGEEISKKTYYKSLAPQNKGREEYDQ